MNKYIVHKRFRGLAACNKTMNLPYGTELQLHGNFICNNGDPICYPSSDNAFKHFAINDDGNGLERGKITYAIAYATRNKGVGSRFNEDEINLLNDKYSHFLKPNLDYIVFNQRFFEADIEELRSMTKEFNIKIS